MKPNSLIVPIGDYAEWAKIGGYTMSPFYPNSSTICIIKAIDNGNLLVEETAAYIGGIETTLDASCWREVQAPGEVNVDALVEESKNYELVEIIDYGE